MDVFDWITKELAPTPGTSETLLYEHMASQSGRCLPLLYQPFDPANPSHWRDRGAALDFVLATRSAGKRVLDFGPGDGWPSLIIAPSVGEVVGVEGAHRRVRVCRENAARLGISNASFRYVPPGDPLPFGDGSFDAVVAASSVEQTPDPRATLAEFCRVLKPGGRVRLYYEALGRYRDLPARGGWVWPTNDGTRLMLSNRRIDEDIEEHTVLVFSMSEEELAAALGQPEGFDVARLDVPSLEAVRAHLVEAGTYTLRHPSGPTLHRWLKELGFAEAYGTHSAIYAAGMLYDALTEADRPATLSAIDAYLRPFSTVIVELRAPLDWDPMITAVK